ncbi:MAG: hypothetical protein KGK10_09325 [Rhodospirillales bacterium]|nr:hypothetical protein [Rhodospirillales bacterium]
MSGHPENVADRKGSLALIFVSALFLVPIALLLALFIRESHKNIDFVNKEIAGLDYAQTVWPVITDVLSTQGERLGVVANRWDKIRKAGEANDREMGTLGARVALGRAMSQAGNAHQAAGRILDAAIALLNTIDDGSNLTLDTDLESFYVMDSATVRLPALAIHSLGLEGGDAIPESDSDVDTPPIVRRGSNAVVATFQASLLAFDRSVTAVVRASGDPHPTLSTARNRIDAIAATLIQAVGQDATGSANPAGGARVAALNQALIQAESRYWDIATAQLHHLLEARAARMQRAQWNNLLAVVAVCAGIFLIVGLMAFSANRGLDKIAKVFRTK